MQRLMCNKHLSIQINRQMSLTHLLLYKGLYLKMQWQTHFNLATQRKTPTLVSSAAVTC
jgi:hypothetical protein